MSEAFSFPLHFEYQQAEQKHHEHHFYNPDLKMFLSYASADLNAQIVRQKTEILDRVPQTDLFPSIYSIAYRKIVPMVPETGTAPYGLDGIVRIPYQNDFIEGASFSRVRKKQTFSQNEFNTIVLTENDMLERNALGLMFRQDGSLMTRPEFLTVWQAAYTHIYQSQPSRETAGAIVKYTAYLKDQLYDLP